MGASQRRVRGPWVTSCPAPEVAASQRRVRGPWVTSHLAPEVGASQRRVRGPWVTSRPAPEVAASQRRVRGPWVTSRPAPEVAASLQCSRLPPSPITSAAPWQDMPHIPCARPALPASVFPCMLQGPVAANRQHGPRTDAHSQHRRPRTDTLVEALTRTLAQGQVCGHTGTCPVTDVVPVPPAAWLLPRTRLQGPRTAPCALPPLRTSARPRELSRSLARTHKTPLSLSRPETPGHGSGHALVTQLPVHTSVVRSHARHQRDAQSGLPQLILSLSPSCLPSSRLARSRAAGAAWGGAWGGGRFLCVIRMGRTNESRSHAPPRPQRPQAPPRPLKPP
ncbi:mucin-1-like [Gopherus flavomarginatus]|uniref:mucin-1-like n=1 Tax=Gopherus flavomarginatus TaxID=286002 RepID=UPI0021CC0D97|nr:mucin-1-like [Gopherus flavomarginatus]